MSRRKGTAGFIAQRASAVVLLPLVLWFLWSLVAHAGADYEAARAWGAEPRNAILTALLLGFCAFHMRIGLAQVIEDYIHDGLKGPLMALNWLAALGVAGAGAFAAFTLAA